MQPRYTDFPLPTGRYLPGEGVHPRRRPAASHIPELPDASTAFSAQTWRQSKRYLYAIDLFNYGYWWEAHEVLETLWIETGKKTPAGLFLQGLIQICAALIKKTQAMRFGALRLAGRGMSKMILRKDVFLGIDVNRSKRMWRLFSKTLCRSLP
jgi:hypothetical protein